MDNLSLKRDKRLIIPRALYFVESKESFESQVKILETYYSKKEILDILLNTSENISNKVCEYVSNRYHSKQFHRFSIRESKIKKRKINARFSKQNGKNNK